MAQKRMFDKIITNDDNFLEMPNSTQALYFHLSMNADDDGFVNNWKSIMKITGTKEDDLKILISKSYLIPFDSGIIVIKHWRINNYLRGDRYRPTQFQKEFNMLENHENKAYQLKSEWSTAGIPMVNPDKNRIEKNREEENSIDKSNQLANADSFAQSQKYLNNINQDINKVTLFYEQNIGLLSSFILEEIEEYQNQIPDDMIIEAIKRAVEVGKRNWKYIKGIINNWISQGIKTLAEVQQNDEAFKKAKEQKQGRNIIETPEQEKERLLKEQEEYLKRKAEREQKEAKKRAKEEDAKAKEAQSMQSEQNKKVDNAEAINRIKNILKKSNNS